MRASSICNHYSKRWRMKWWKTNEKKFLPLAAFLAISDRIQKERVSGTGNFAGSAAVPQRSQSVRDTTASVDSLSPFPLFVSRENRAEGEGCKMQAVSTRTIDSHTHGQGIAIGLLANDMKHRKFWKKSNLPWRFILAWVAHHRKREFRYHWAALGADFRMTQIKFQNAHFLYGGQSL